MKKNTRSVVIGILTVFLATSLIYAHDQPETRGGPGKGHRDARIQQIAEKLGLTPEQQQKLKDNHKAQRERMQEIVGQIKEKQQTLRTEINNPSVTKESLSPILTEINSLQRQLMEGRIDGILAVKEIMTPEQFAEFQQITENKQQGMRKRLQRFRKRMSREVQHPEENE